MQVEVSSGWFFFSKFDTSMKLAEKDRTPAECHVYRKWYTQISALQRSAMCPDLLEIVQSLVIYSKAQK